VLTVGPMRLAPLAALLLALAAGCQDPDVGQRCTLGYAAANADPVSADWLESGNAGCPNLVCMKSPVPAGGTRVKNNPYCSKGCVSDRDCYSGETGLVCRQVVLDPDFLAFLDSLDPSQCGAPAGTNCRQKYVGDVQFSSYCAMPLP